jgi:translation initiation factor 1 (eIF-1/SUI1)
LSPRRRTPRSLKESALSDKLQAELTKAAGDEVLAILREMVKEKPDVQIRQLQRHHVDRIAVAAISGFLAKRHEQEEMARVLDDPLPESWLA